MPEIAIVDSNTLAVIGLQQLLETVMPMAEITTFPTFDTFKTAGTDRFVHFFVSMHIVLEHRAFFMADAWHQRHTIVLCPSNDPNSQLQGFHLLCTGVSEPVLIKQLLALQHQGHPHGEHYPATQGADTNINKEKALSDREREVLSLVAQGKTNKEIADYLCIAIYTVISHRKNIQEKLGLKSVSSLTIYAVMHGYVDINKI